METTRMDLLVTLDEHYLPQLRVMLTSLRLSHPGVQCRVYLLPSEHPGGAAGRAGERPCRMGLPVGAYPSR